MRLELGNRKDGLALTKGALKLEVGKDAFHLETVWELLTRLKDVLMDDAKAQQDAAIAAGDTHTSHLANLKATYAPLLPIISSARKRIGPKHEKDELGSLAVYAPEPHRLCRTHSPTAARAQGQESPEKAPLTARRAVCLGALGAGLLQDGRRGAHARAGLRWRRGHHPGGAAPLPQGGPQPLSLTLITIPPYPNPEQP